MSGQAPSAMLEKGRSAVTMTGGSNATALNMVKGYLQGETHSAWRARSRGLCRLAVTEAGAPGFERAKIGGRRGGVCGHLPPASKPQCRQVAPWGERESGFATRPAVPAV